MIIRKFQANDAEEVAKLIIRTFREVNIKDYSKEFIEAEVKNITPEFLINRS